MLFSEFADMLNVFYLLFFDAASRTKLRAAKRHLWLQTLFDRLPTSLPNA